MSATTVERDERTVAIENASYRWGYKILAFGILVLAAYRSLVLDEAPWDLMALVILGGAIPSVYQGANHILGRRWLRLQLVALVAAAIVAALIAMARR